MRTCILSDNQYVTSEGILSALKCSDLCIIIKASNLAELQEKLKCAPDAVVIIDYTLFDFASLEQLLNFKQAFPKSSWVLFSNELGDYFLRCITASDPTVSVVMKGDPKEEIFAAIESAKYDIPFICEAVQQILKAEPDAPPEQPIKLTASEKIILHEIAKGKTTKEIAYEKFLSFHTVNSHRKNIFRKLGVNNLHEAIRYAIRAGIFDVAEYYI